MATEVASWSDEVRVDEAMRHTASIAQWVRLSGTDDERKAFDYIDAELRGFGYTTRLHQPTCLVSLPISGSLLVGEEAFVPCITHSFSVGTPDDGLAGEMVYAGRGTEAELRAAGAAGKIALTDGLATPNKAHDATKIGALAVVSISGDHIHEMIVSPVWGSPTLESLNALPKVVMLSIDTEGGERIKALLAEGRQRARVRATVETAWRPIPVLLADLDVEGDGAHPEYVLFSGHVDSWHYGAMDNATANATMMETARILGEHRGELRRGVRYAFWSGHSHARYAGSAWFADRYWFDLRERCVVHVNVDSTGAIGATQLAGANTMADTYGFAKEIIQRQTGQELTYRRFGRAGDQSFWGVGLSSIFMSLSEQGAANEMTADQAFLLGGTSARGGGLGWWWHTTEDTLDKIDPAHLERDIRVYVEVMARLTTEESVGLDPVAALDEIEQTVREIEPQWAGLPLGSDDDDVGFGALYDDLGRARSLAVRSMGGDSAATARAIVEACKALVPVNYTRSGEFEQDPAIGAAAVPGLRPSKAVVEMSDDERWAATHGLRRAINRVRHGIRQAEVALEGAAKR